MEQDLEERFVAGFWDIHQAQESCKQITAEEQEFWAREKVHTVYIQYIHCVGLAFTWMFSIVNSFRKGTSFLLVFIIFFKVHLIY